MLPNASAPSLRSICAEPRIRPRGDRTDMEIKSHLADRFVARPPADLVAALVYGPDQGMVRERAAALARSVVADLNDPFRVAELDEAGPHVRPPPLSAPGEDPALASGR